MNQPYYESLDGKTCIVTGGVGDIGSAIVEELSKQGVNGCIADLSSRIAGRQDTSPVQINGRCKWIYAGCDVTKMEQVASMMWNTYSEFGRIDFLINNAGLIWIQPMLNCTKADFNKVMEVNFYGAIACTKAAFLYMKENEIEAKRGNVRGKVINMGSTSGLRVGKDSLLYSSTKHDLIFLTDDILLELGDEGILAYSLAPGIFPSQGYDWIKYAIRKGQDFDDSAKARKWMTEYYREQIPLDRVGRMEEIGQFVAFLLSTEGDFLNGSVIPITGGRF